MAAITWRNINGPSLADAARPLAYAQQGIASGFDVLGSALKEFQQGEQAIWKQQDADYTQQQLGLMYGAKTPEELAALKASGALTQAVAPNGARLDLGVVNKAMDGREGVLQNRLQDEWKFAQAKVNKEESPIVSNARALMLNKDYDGVKRLMATLSPENQAAVAAELDKTQNEFRLRDQNEQKFKQDILASNASIAASGAQARASDSTTKLNQVKLLENQLEAVDKKLAASESLVGSNAGYAKVEDYLKSIKDEKTRFKLERAVGQALTAGNYNDLTASQVIKAMQAVTDTPDAWWNTTGDGLTKKLDEAKGNPLSAEQRTKMINRTAELEKMRSDLQEKLYPGLSSVVPARPIPGAPGAAGGSVVPVAPVAPGAAAAEQPAPAAVRQESPAQALAKQEAEIRAAFAEPKYETPYDRMNRLNGLNTALERARKEAEPISPQAAADRAAAAKLWENIKDANGNAGAAIADIGMLPPRLALSVYDTAVLRPLRAAGIDLPNTAPLLTPNGVSTGSITPFTDVRRMRKALQDEAKKKR